MNSISDYSGIIIAICIGLFFATRWINLWYWKINDFKKGQEEQIRLLKKIAGEEEIEETVPIEQIKPKESHF